MIRLIKKIIEYFNPKYDYDKESLWQVFGKRRT